MEKTYTQKEMIEFLKGKLSTDTHWAENALLKIYSRQTYQEKMHPGQGLAAENGVGFTRSDAEFLTSLAQQYSTRKSLSQRQYHWLKKKMGKYARQLFHYPEFDREHLCTIMEREAAAC